MLVDTIQCFCDDDINFDLQLEELGVDTNALREPATERVFHAWVQDKLGSKMIQLQRHTCSRSIKVLSFVILTLTKHILSLRKT